MALAEADPATGRLVWTVPVQGDLQVFSGLVLAGGSVLGQWAGCQGGPAGVAAVDAQTGMLQWRTPGLPGGETVSDRWGMSAQDGIYVDAGPQGGRSNGQPPPSATVVGVSVTDGSLRWQRPAAGDLVAAALDRRVVAVLTRSGAQGSSTVTAIDRDTGTVLWTALISANAPTLAADDAHIYVSSGPTGDGPGTQTAQTSAYAARTGHLDWRADGTDPRVGPHVVAVQVPVPMSTSPSGYSFVGLDAQTGQRRWQRNDIVDLGERVATADGRTVVSNTANGTIDVLDIDTGTDLWKQAATDVLVARSNGIILFGPRGQTDPGVLFTPADGRPVTDVVAHLAVENDQISIPPEITTDHHVILARGCPGRG